MSKTVEEAWAFYMTTIPPDDRYDTPTGDFVSGYNQGRAAGVAHGAVVERQRIEALIDEVMESARLGKQIAPFTELKLRIRQRGEK